MRADCVRRGRRLAQSRALLLSAATAAVISQWSAQARAALTPGANNTITTSDTTGAISIQSLTFNPPGGNPNSTTPVNLTQTPGTNLDFSATGIIKNGLFTSLISGGTITSSTTPDPDLGVTVNAGGALTISSALSGANLALIKSGLGTLELASTNSAAHTIGYGYFLNAGTLRISSDANLGANAGNTADLYFQGGTLEISANPVNFSSTRNVDFASGGGTLRVNSGLALTIDDANQFTGTGTINKTGDGTLRIGSANSFAGNVNVQQGILELQHADALAINTTTRSRIILQSGATLALRADDTNPTPPSEVNFGNDVAIPNTGFSGPAAVIEVDRVSSTTPTNFKLGKLDIGTFGTGTDLVTDTRLTVRSGHSPAETNRSLEFSGTTTVNGDVEIENTVDLRLGGLLTGNGSLTKTGAGRLTLGGIDPNTYTDITRVLGGTLELAKQPGINQAANAVPGDLEIQGGTVVLTTPNQIANDADILLTGGNLQLNGFDEEVSSLDNQGGNITTGAGTLTVTSPNTSFLDRNSTTTINAGGSLDSVHLVVKGGLNVVQAGGAINIGAIGLEFSANGQADPMTASPDPQLRLNSSAATPGMLVLEGDVDATFTNSSIAATARISLGTGPVPNAGEVQLVGTRVFTVNNGGNAVDMEIGASITGGDLQKAGGGILRLTGNNSHASTILSGGILEAAGAGALGNGDVLFQGGTLSFRGDVPLGATTSFGKRITSSLGGSITIDIGRASGAGSLGNFAVGEISIGPALNVTGNSGGTLVSEETVTIQANNSTINNAVGVAFNGSVGGNFGITKTGNGTLTLGGSSSNTFLGTLTVTGGTVELNKSGGATAIPDNLTVNAPGSTVASVNLLASNQIGDTKTVNLQSLNATLNLGSQSETIASLSGAGKVILGEGGVLTIDSIGASSFSGVISGAGRLVKDGDPSAPVGLSLSGANTFTGGVSAVVGPVTFTAQAPGHENTSLTSGKWEVFADASLNFNVGNNITTINPGASVLLSGQTAQFSKINSLTTNNGTFSITGGKTFTVSSPFSNSGTLNVGGSGTSSFTVNSTTAQVANVSGVNTLTGGTWNVLENGSLSLSSSPDIATIGSNATVRLAGGSSFTKINNVSANQGTFAVTNGRSFTTTGNFSNTGTLIVGGGTSASSFSVTGTTAQLSSGTLGAGNWQVLENGTLSLSGAGNITTIASPASVTLRGSTSQFGKIAGLANNQGVFTLEGGRNFTTAGALSNSGTVNVGAGSLLRVSGNLTNTEVVNAAGTLHVTGQVSGMTGMDRIDMSSAVVIGNMSLEQARLLVHQGHNGDAWTGGGITSSAAANDPNAVAAIGFATFANYSELGATEFQGVTGLDGDDMVFRLTYYGDSNLDGDTTTDDFLYFLAGLDDNEPSIGGTDQYPETWYYGDYDYSGLVTTDDFLYFIHGLDNDPVQNAEIAQLIELSSLSVGDKATLQGMLAAVPEPTTFALLGLAACGQLSRRRRR